MEINWTEVIVAIIALISTVLGGLSYEKAKHQKSHIETIEDVLAEREVELKQARSQLKQRFFRAHEVIDSWDIHNQINSLLQETCIDRILMLEAWNGVADPQWCTATYQWREGWQRKEIYEDVRLDSDYQNRLALAKLHGGHEFVVDEMPDSLIRGIYKREGVTHSLWMVINVAERNTEGVARVVFMSFSTHGDKPIDDDSKIAATLVANRFRALMTSSANEMQL